MEEIDVSGCEYYKNGICQWSYRIQPPCNEIKDCYYTQLKRKEKDYNELENTSVEIIRDYRALLDLAKQLINKTLEQFHLTRFDWQEDQNEITTALQKFVDSEKECEELKAYRDAMEQADFKGSFDKQCVENRKLIGKLKKIKDIAITLGNQEDVKCKLSEENVKQLLGIENDLLTTEDILRKYILQIINEVEEDAPTIKEEKYYNLLQEIKELCEFNSCSYDNGIEYVFVDDVLQIISEVEK